MNQRLPQFWPRSSTLIESPSPIESTLAAIADWAKGGQGSKGKARQKEEDFRVLPHLGHLGQRQWSKRA